MSLGVGGSASIALTAVSPTGIDTAEALASSGAKNPTRHAALSTQLSSHPSLPEMPGEATGGVIARIDLAF